ERRPDTEKENEKMDLAEAEASDESMVEVDGIQPMPKEIQQTNGVHKQEPIDSKQVASELEPGLVGTATPHPTLRSEAKQNDEADTVVDQMDEDATNHHDETAEDGDNEDNCPSTTSTPPLPLRRITRALAAEAETTSNAQIASPPPTSPTLSSHSPSSFEPHPLFLLPPALATAHAPHHAYPMMSLALAHSGLPPDELLETRKLLSLYIQKSEETIRGLESILGKLIKAKRRRERLWSWCTAEGHVGEMSDGEDWIDEKEWGLEMGELRKGRDEDASALVEGAAVANGEGGLSLGEDTSVIIGGRKGKRRGRAKD
ncbi:MAG: hypothetical protein Q9181_008355, partial [Wetmoreana brouardii]